MTFWFKCCWILIVAQYYVASSFFSLSHTHNSKLNLNVLKCSPVGTCWVYPIYPPNYTGALYCNKTTYQFAFIITTLVWATMSLVFVCGGCFAILTCCTTVVARRRLIPNRNTFYGATSDSAESTAGDVWFQFLSPNVKGKWIYLYNVWQEWNFSQMWQSRGLFLLCGFIVIKYKYLNSSFQNCYNIFFLQSSYKPLKKGTILPLGLK